MHLESEELLALRDGEARPEVAAHVAGCPACAAELEHLRAVARELAGLPVAGPPADRWATIAAAVEAERRGRRRLRTGLAAAAAVAVVGVAIAALVLAPRPGTRAAGAGDAAVSDLEQLIGASHQLESVLQGSELEGRVLSSRDAAWIVDLEDRIALVDARLAGPEPGLSREQAVALWLDRVELLDALVEAHGATANSPAFQRVSYQ